MPLLLKSQLPGIRSWRSGNNLTVSLTASTPTMPRWWLTATISPATLVLSRSVPWPPAYPPSWSGGNAGSRDRDVHYNKSRANFIPSLICLILSWSKVVIKVSRCAFGMVMIVSRLITHFLGSPSDWSKETSTGMFRIVEVISATVTALRTEYAASLESNTTGRLPMGGGKFAHHTSPLFMLKLT